MPKTDKIEYEKRVMAVQSWIIEGVPPTIIVQQIRVKGWSTSDRHAYRILKAAREKWLAIEEESIEDERKLQIQRLQNRIRGMSIEHKSTPKGMNTILSYEKEISKLRNLYRFQYKPAPDATEDFYIPPAQVVPEDPGDIDYDKLTDEVLMAIASARRKND